MNLKFCGGWQLAFLLAALLAISSFASPAHASSQDDAALIPALDFEAAKARVFTDPRLAEGVNLSSMPRYDLKLTLTSNLGRYTVEERLQFKPSAEGITRITLQIPANAGIYSQAGAAAVTVESAAVNGKAAEFTLKGEMLELTAKEPLESGKEADVALKFAVDVPKLDRPPSQAQEGLEQMMQLFGGGHNHSKNYGVFSLSDGILSLGHWYAVLPHTESGESGNKPLSGIGDPANFDAANYNVEINYPEGVELATSGVEGEAILEDGVKKVSSIALAAREFTVSASREFKKSSATAGTTVINVFLKQANEDQRREITEYASNSLQYFSKVFGPYPFKELDVVEAPLRGGAGGMEYSGLITVSSGLMAPMDFSELPLFKNITSLSPGAEALDLTKDIIEFTIAHEVAHQWWHGVIGSNAKREPFLDESLTNYSTILYFENKHGRAAAAKQEYLQLELVYQLYRISGNGDAPVARPAESFSDIMQYGAIVYAKGALFYRALRRNLGDEAFFAFLRRYYDNNRFGYATRETLASTLTEAVKQQTPGSSSDEAGRLLTRWLDGTYGDADIGVLEVDRFAEMVLGPKIFEGKDGAKARMLLKLIGPLAIAMNEE